MVHATTVWAGAFRGDAMVRLWDHREMSVAEMYDVDSTAVGEDAAEAFIRDGAICVRGMLDHGDVARAQEAIDAVVARPGPLAIVASGEDDPGFFIEDFRRWGDVPALRDLAGTTRVATAVATILGTRTLRFFHDHVLVKEAGTRQRTPWHQDQPYYNVSGRQVASVWIPVDEVPIESSLEIAAGTHAGPWLMPRTFLDQEAKWFPEGSLGELPDIDADRSAHSIISAALAPGDAIVFHALAVHGTAGFAGPGRRRVLSLRYVGDDARHAPRRWRTSPPFEGLEDELPADAPLDHPLFPLVHGGQ